MPCWPRELRSPFVPSRHPFVPPYGNPQTSGQYYQMSKRSGSTCPRRVLLPPGTALTDAPGCHAAMPRSPAACRTIGRPHETKQAAPDPEASSCPILLPRLYSYPCQKISAAGHKRDRAHHAAASFTSLGMQASSQYGTPRDDLHRDKGRTWFAGYTHRHAVRNAMGAESVVACGSLGANTSRGTGRPTLLASRHRGQAGVESSSGIVSRASLLPS
jgi:hypothetical protein